MTEPLLMQGDCLDLLQGLPDGGIDMVLCDLPYGTTACKWDSVIPFGPLWTQYRRVVKPDGAIVLFGSQPFTSLLIASNLKMFKYCWVWEKTVGTGFLDAKRKPLKCHEDLCVFYSSLPTYNPQKWEGSPNHGCKASTRKTKSVHAGDFGRPPPDLSGLKYPRSVVKFGKHSSSENLHPTQKPVALLEYLIKTYTRIGEVVLDNTMGSGSTGVAAVNTGRGFVGMELDGKYFSIAQDRIRKAREEFLSRYPDSIF